MKSIVKTFAVIVMVAAVSVPAIGGGVGTLAVKQAGFADFASKGIGIPAPGAPARAKSILPRDIFSETQACGMVDAYFLVQPTIKDALNMLAPCLAGISRQNGNTPISTKAVYKGAEVMKIVISVSNDRQEYVTSLIRASLSKRYNQLFGYPAETVMKF